MSKMSVFSDEEMSILLDSNFLLTKRVALEKITHLLAELAQQLQQLPLHTSFPFPTGTDTTLGKISKGENYKGLPYRILDFPKLFEKNTIFAYRSMFWWGNEFSFTLHLGGAASLQYQARILQSLKELKKQQVYFCINDTPWEYDFGKNNYCALSDLNSNDVETHISKNGFVKLSRILVLEEWQQLVDYGCATYALFLRCLSTELK